MAHAIPVSLVNVLEAAITRDMREQRTKLSTRRAAAVALGLHGLRSQETCNLLRRDLDAARHVLRVRTVKHGRWRMIELHPLLSRTLIGINSGADKAAPLITTHTGRPLQSGSVQRYGRWLRRLLRIDCSMHSLRHTAAHKLYNATHDVYAVQRMLGHATLRQTHVYLQTQVPVEAEHGPSLYYGIEQPPLLVYTGPLDDERRAERFRHHLIENRVPPPRGEPGLAGSQRRAAALQRITAALEKMDPVERESVIREIIMREWAKPTDPPQPGARGKPRQPGGGRKPSAKT